MNKRTLKDVFIEAKKEISSWPESMKLLSQFRTEQMNLFKLKESNKMLEGIELVEEDRLEFKNVFLVASSNEDVIESFLYEKAAKEFLSLFPSSEGNKIVGPVEVIGYKDKIWLLKDNSAIKLNTCKKLNKDNYNAMGIA